MLRQRPWPEQSSGHVAIKYKYNNREEMYNVLRSQAAPVKLGKQEQVPAVRSQTPAPEHSLLPCAVVVAVATSPHAGPEGHITGKLLDTTDELNGITYRGNNPEIYTRRHRLEHPNRHNTYRSL